VASPEALARRAGARRRIGLRQLLRPAVAVRLRGLLWRPFDSAPAAYVKLAAGVVHGYKDEYQDKIPLNSSGFAPAIMGSVGYCYNRICSEIVIAGTAGLMWTLGVTLP